MRPRLDSPRPKAKRIVKPRTPSTTDKPIIAVHNDQVMLETGELFPYEKLPIIIAKESSSIVVTHLVGHMVRDLDKALRHNPRWQFRATPVERQVWGPNRTYKTSIRETTINFFGFQGKSKKKGHYHYPVDPSVFCLKTANQLRRGIDENPSSVHKLMEWAKELREFLIEQELKLSPTSGGIAAQLLRDKRFYPNARRKVPRHTNGFARDKLPGNFYELYAAEENVSYAEAAYLDQSAAHHNAAKDLQFPSADTLRRRGRYSTLTDVPYARYGSENYEKLIKQHGLFYLAIECPRFMPGTFPLPECAGSEGYKKGFFYSNELGYLKELGVRIRHIIACWTSPNTENGLNNYGQFALETIQEASKVKRAWLKPTLLSTYGVLAAKPKKLEFGYKHADEGEEKKYPCGSGFLTVQAKRMENFHEMPMANVLHRGMIEAETRLRSILLARDLTKQGFEVLAIYADSVFVNGGQELPILPHPWRLQNHLTNLKFHDSTHFTSHEIDKLPGVSKNRLKNPPIRPMRTDRRKAIERLDRAA